MLIGKIMSASTTLIKKQFPASGDFAGKTFKAIYADARDFKIFRKLSKNENVLEMLDSAKKCYGADRKKKLQDINLFLLEEKYMVRKNKNPQKYGKLSEFELGRKKAEIKYPMISFSKKVITNSLIGCYLYKNQIKEAESDYKGEALLKAALCANVALFTTSPLVKTVRPFLTMLGTKQPIIAFALNAGISIGLPVTVLKQIKNFIFSNEISTIVQFENDSNTNMDYIT